MNAAVPWRNAVEAGDVLDLGNGATITLSGTSFDGTADAFLDQVLRSEGDDRPEIEGARGTVTTGAGLVGVVRSSTSPGGDELDVAFKVGTGTDAEAAPALLVQVRTSPGQFEQYQDEVAGGVLLFGLYLVPWLLLLRHHNRYTGQPAGLLATGFVWGGFAAAFWIALPANTALLELWAKVGGTAFAQEWAAGLTAPINEEFGKALGLVLLIGIAPRLVRSAYDGFIIGAFIGLGFQIFEDVLYVYNGATQTYGVDQFGSAIQMFLYRGAAGIVSHALFSAIFCAGLMWVLGRTPGERNVVRGVLTMLTAMVFHFAWDDMTGIGGGGTFAVVLPFLIGVVELVVLFYVLRHAARQERTWIRDLLTPEIGTGAIDQPLLDAVSGLRKERKAYRKQLHSRRRARHRLEAAGDLAHELAGAGGHDTDRVTHARTELLHQGDTT